MTRSLILVRALALVFLLLVGATVGTPSADARVDDIDTIRIDGDGVDFGLGRFRFWRFDGSGRVEWGNNRDGNPAVMVTGFLASSHLWSGCAKGSIKIFSTNPAVFPVEEEFATCNFISTSFDKMFLTSRDPRMNRVEVCTWDPAVGQQTCITRGR